MRKIIWRLKQRARRLAHRCYICGESPAPWVYTNEQGNEVRACEWDNARLQMERIAVPIRRES